MSKIRESQSSEELFLNLTRNFSDDDKEKCIPLICRIIGFANLVRKEGILALEDEVAQESNLLLKQGIILIVDGTDPILVNQILQNFTLSDNYSGFELLSRLIIIEGILAVQQGEHPVIMELRLSSMLGEKYVSAVKQAIGRTEQKLNNLINDFLKRIADNKALEESEKFETEILGSDLRSIYTILSKTDLRDFTVALHGCSAKSIQKILFELSDNLTARFINDWDIRPVGKEYIILAQNRILKKIEELKSTGDIISFQDILQNLQDSDSLAFIAIDEQELNCKNTEK